ncbi:MAG: cupin domain-containing protein [Deltaproteobacteria bacterium]|nr:cupin domain-containing protein [Deltaproteobacteria bacterium]
MSLLDAVQIVTGRRREDARGWLHVALGASQLPTHARFGELYVVRALARGDRRGDHLHPGMDEWFTVVDGEARLELVDPETRARRELTLSASDPQTVRVPAGLAHCFVNLADGPLTIIAWATAEYDPTDVVPFETS